MEEVVEEENHRKNVLGQTNDTNFPVEEEKKTKKRIKDVEDVCSRKKPRKNAKVTDTSKIIRVAFGKAEDRPMEDGDFLPALRKTANKLQKKILDLDPTLDISDDDSDDDKHKDNDNLTIRKTERKRTKKKSDDDEYIPESKNKSGKKSKLKRESDDDDEFIRDDDDDDDDEYVPVKELKKTKSNRDLRNI